MWNPFGRADSESLTPAMHNALATAGISAEQIQRVRVTTRKGKYDNRDVTYFYVYEPGPDSGATAGHTYDTLPAASILYSGFREGNGRIVVRQGKT